MPKKKPQADEPRFEHDAFTSVCVNLNVGSTDPHCQIWVSIHVPNALMKGVTFSDVLRIAKVIDGTQGLPLFANLFQLAADMEEQAAMAI